MELISAVLVLFLSLFTLWIIASIVLMCIINSMVWIKKIYNEMRVIKNACLSESDDQNSKLHDFYSLSQASREKVMPALMADPHLSSRTLAIYESLIPAHAEAIRKHPNYKSVASLIQEAIEKSVKEDE